MGGLGTDFVTRMYAIIPILQLLLTPNFALLESNEPTEADLECLNDYDKELVCQMKLNNCSEYNLNVSLEFHSSSFQHFPPSTCEWKFQVYFFVQAENFTARLWRGDKILFTKNISTSESIKPKRPINLSVKRTDDGNFVITWNTNYTELHETFIESLSTQLKYGIKGSGSYDTINVTSDQQRDQIVGRKLQSNSDYVVKARVSTNYNDNMRFSDYSEEYEFRTTSSTQEILKIIIPIVCVILIIFIFTVFYCYIQIRRKLWDELPTPEIASTFKQFHILPLFENDFSLIRVEDSLLDLIENNDCEISASQTDVNYKYRRQPRLKADVDSAPVEHDQVHSSSRGQNKVTVAPVVSKLQRSMSYNALENLPSIRAVVTFDSFPEMKKDYGSSAGLLSFSNRLYFASSLLDLNSRKNVKSLGASTKPAPKLLSNKVHNSLLSDNNTDIQKKSGNNFRNRSYSESSSSSFFKSSTTLFYQSNENNNPFPDLSINQHPVIPTDLDYSPCGGCSGPADSNPAQTTPCCTETDVVSEYQSVNKLLNPRNKSEIDLWNKHSFHSDVNLIRAKPVCYKNPQDVPILHVYEGYQSFLSLDLNTLSSDLSTKLEQTVAQTSYVSQQVHTPLSMSLCGPALNISPGIQIDCSYQRV